MLTADGGSRRGVVVDAGSWAYFGRVRRTEKLYPTETGWPW